MRDSDTTPSSKRRGFLFAGGLTAAAAAAWSALPKSAATSSVSEPEAKISSSGYHDGERARRYYDSTRI